MRILILGGTGFIGTPLAAALIGLGYGVTVTTRGHGQPECDYLYAPHRAVWDGVNHESLVPLLGNADVVIHLQGANIAESAWTPARKQAIRQSRVRAGSALVLALQQLEEQGASLPHTLIQASASGWYGLWEDMQTAPLCLEDAPSGQGFLAETCFLWEQATQGVEDLGLRRCIVRLAPVLGRVPSGAAGGFLGRLVTPFHFFMGAVPGTGRQPMSWVHMDDVLGTVEWLLNERLARGIYNVCAPQQVSAAEFVRALGQVLQRPALFKLPGFVLRAAYGDMADELILAGQCMHPQRLLEGGYAFHFPQLAGALRDVLE